MHVAVNLRSANLAIPDGHGESLRNLSRALIPTNPGHALRLLMDARPRYALPASPQAHVQVAPPFPVANLLLRRALGADPWYRLRICAARGWRRTDVLIQSAHEPTPVLTGPRHVALVLDVAFLRPGAHHYFDPATYDFLDRWTAENIHRASRLVAISAWVKAEVTRWYGIDADRIAVAPLGMDPHRFRPADGEAAPTPRAQHGSAPPYFLFVGTLQPRKNLATLVAGYLAARAHGIRHELILAGAPGWRYHELAPLVDGRAADGIRPLGRVPPEDLPGLYTGATAFASVARDEGFGLPALEAMAAGTPVVVSNQAGLADVVADAGLQVDPSDPSALADALVRLAEDATLRADLRRRGLERAAEFTWERAARVVWDTVERA
ncbi:MAG: glycosyltransferase family 4 protein [Actinobacteria bacterium]|nr:glycosyltransferase family 4 protein [Actinomycetota bacterium]